MASRVANGEKVQKQGWMEFVAGLLLVFHDWVLQRPHTRHLPSRLKLPSLANLSCIVTGSTSGIGLNVAWELAKAGADVVMACRNTAAAEDLIRAWQKEQEEAGGPPLHLEVMKLDLLSLASVKSFARDWEDQGRSLHLLVNNAGIFSMGVPVKYSGDGFEEHLQVNHLAPALLSLLLMPSLLRSGRGRIVNVNSVMHEVGFNYTEDLNFSSGKRRYSSTAAYSGSKLSQLLFSRVLQGRLKEEAGVHIVSIHPGDVLSNVVRTLPKLFQLSTRLLGPIFLFSPAEGARSVLFCCTDGQVEEYVHTLRKLDFPYAPYYSYACRPATPGRYARDKEASLKVWDRTLEMLNLTEGDIQILLTGKA